MHFFGQTSPTQPYRGIVTNCDVDNVTGGEMWEITYEDMDVEDLHHNELMKVLLPVKVQDSKWGSSFYNFRFTAHVFY